MPHSGQAAAIPGRQCFFRDTFQAGRNGQVHRVREACSLEESNAEDFRLVQHSGITDQSQVPSGDQCLRSDISDPSETQNDPCLQRPDSLRQGSASRPTVDSGIGSERQEEGAHGPRDVPARCGGHDASWEQNGKVVDLPEMPVSLGEASCQSPQRSSSPRSSAREPQPSGRESPHLREAHRLDVPSSLPGGSGVLRVDSQDDRGAGSPVHRSVGILPPSPVCAVHLAPEDSGNSRSGRLARHGSVGAVNRLAHGTSLAALAFTLTIGYMAQIVTAGLAYPDLEGPVFGTRVGIYHVDSLSSPVPVRESSASVRQQNDTEPGASGFRIVLYKLPHGAVEESNVDDNPSDPTFGVVSTVPAGVKSKIAYRLANQTTHVLPVRSAVSDSQMPPIPEDSALPSASVRQQDGEWNPDDQFMPGERVEIDNDACPLSDDDEPVNPQGEDFRPTAQQLKDFKIAHDNSGHPSASDFARMIKLGNGKPELVRWVKHHFKCDDCEANKRPKSRRPSAVPKTYRFNHVVGIDLLELKDPAVVRCFFFNAICWGTSLQQVKIVCGDNAKTAENVWNTFVDAWIRVYGLPDVLVLDPGKEFEGYFTDMAQAYGITILPTDRESPWQNGKTERAGGLWKRNVKIASRKCTPVNRTEFLMLGDLLCVAQRNRSYNRSGYSPLQRVFGTNHRLPNSILSDDAIDPSLLCDNPVADCQRAEELRVAATRAWAALDSRNRLHKSLRARHRTTHNFTEGMLVFVWRQPRVGQGKWIGPGLVIIPTAGGCWVNMRGSLWRCSNEQLGPATNDESMAELINRYLGELRWDLQRNRGPKKYVDVRAEGHPVFPGDPESDDDEECPII